MMVPEKEKTVSSGQTDKTSIEKHSKKNIIFGSIVGYSILALSIISGLLYTPWIISSIGKSDYGLYTLSNSLISLFLVDFGLGATANTYLARYRAEGRHDKIEHFLSLIYKLYFLIDAIILVVFVIAFFLIDYIYVGLTIDERDKFKIVFIISASFSLFSFPASILNGVILAYEEYIWSKLIDLLNKLLYIGFTALAISKGWGLYSLVIVNSATGFVCICIRYFLVRHRLKIKTPFFEKAAWCDIKPILAFSLWSAVNSVADRLIFNVTPSILGIVSDSNNIAIFGVVASLEGYVYTFGGVMSGFFLPKISRLYQNGDSSDENMQALAIKVGKIQLAILALVEIGFACCGQEFILVWMKHDDSFLAAYWGTLIIIFYQLIFVPELVFYTAMFAKNKVKHLAISSISKAIINLGLSFLFSRFYGAFGSCLAICIARIFELIFQNIYYAKDLGADLPRFFSKVYLPMIIPAAVEILVGLCLHFFLPLSLAYKLIIEVAAMCIVFIPTCWFLSFSKQERAVLFRKNPSNNVR